MRLLRPAAGQVVGVVAGAIEEQADPQQADIFVRVLRSCHVHSSSWPRQSHMARPGKPGRAASTLFTSFKERRNVVQIDWQSGRWPGVGFVGGSDRACGTVVRAGDGHQPRIGKQ
ncbi:hypothetical protein G6F63_013992 [Rhizopus arrhizus]|nr:hypothetical protein G6F63_013992 [Rhizopus arrhizus]